MHPGLHLQASISSHSVVALSLLVPQKLRGVFPFFEKVDRGDRAVLLPPLVLFQSYFVLTSYYEVPRKEAEGRLKELLTFKGLTFPEKALHRACLDILASESTAAPCSRPRLETISDVQKEIECRGGSLSLGQISKVLSALEQDLVIRKGEDGVRLIQPERLLDPLAASYCQPEEVQEVNLKAKLL